MSGATCLFDDRFYRKFLVGDRRIELKFKYQCPTFDVAFLRDEHSPSLSRLLVRVSGLYDLEMDLIPPLIYEMRPHELLFRNELYFNQDEGWWDGDDWPVPLVFSKVASGGTPQAMVRYEAGK
jgi:hypothetical protein